MYGSSGCLACCTKPPLKPLADEPPKGPRLHSQTVRKACISEDFWTSSTRDMDTSQVQSLGSISSISTNNQTLEHNGGPGNANSPAEFVNHGLMLWNQTRQRWIGNKKHDNQPRTARQPRLNWNASYESLLGNSKPFLQPIPLTEMVDFLVDVWEQEGLYD